MAGAPGREEGGDALVGGEVLHSAVAAHEVEADAVLLRVAAHLDRAQAVSHLQAPPSVSLSILLAVRLLQSHAGHRHNLCKQCPSAYLSTL